MNPQQSPNVRALRDLTEGLIIAPADVAVTDVTLDSRAVSPGALFLACGGRTHHGLRFAQEAVNRGARAVLFEEPAGGAPAMRTALWAGPLEAPPVEPPLPAPDFGSDIFVAAVPLLSQYAGLIADRFFGAPAQALTVAGITGTNGKTTCAYLLAQALQTCQRPAAYMGTLGYGVPPSLTATEHTTSDAVNVHRQLAALRGLGAECVSMEVSSHAIDQHRVAAVRFETAVFTNLTRDHLDYHGTMEAYGDTKARLFAWPTLAHRVINVDDPFGAHLAEQLSPARLVVTTRSDRSRLASTGSLSNAEMVRATYATPESAGLRIGIDSSWGPGEVVVPLIGEFNVDNVLTVLAVLLAWNVPLTMALSALATCKAPSGRMEVFGGASAPLAIVDYAHTPDGLLKALRAARTHCRGKLLVVFGCGGDRDAGKRPLMGRIAGELADEVIVTDDNPRTEDPAHIAANILEGLTGRAGVSVEHDRAKAIRSALQRSRPDDVVLVAGKGHEDYQIYGAVRRPFRDQTVVLAALAGASA